VSSLEGHTDCGSRVDAAPYVLGALDQPDAFREHLATCGACRTEVARLQPVVDALPAAVAPASASKDLRARVLATVRSEAELRQAAGRQADRPPAPARRRRSRRASLVATGVAIAAGAGIALAAALNLGSPQRLHVTSAQISAAVQGAHASLRQIGGRSELAVSGMPEPRAGRIYEVWVNRNGSPQPTDALFSVTSRGDGAVDVPESLHGVKEVMVTSEPLGGSPRPTGPPLIRVTLRA